MAAFTDMPGWNGIRNIVIANAAIFMAILAGRLSGANPDVWLALPASPQELLSRPWTVLTYMVTQVEFLHLFFNMLWLWCFAMIADRVLPNPRLVILYLAGGIGGAVGYVMVNIIAGGNGSLCGSSAAVLGIMSYMAVMAGDTRIEMLLLGRMRLRTVVIVATAISLLGAGGSIGALTAHVGGIAAGIVWALKDKAPAKIKGNATHRKGSKVAAALKRHREDSAELDALLDKIRISGFGSLTGPERRRLETLSNRLNLK